MKGQHKLLRWNSNSNWRTTPKTFKKLHIRFWPFFYYIFVLSFAFFCSNHCYLQLSLFSTPLLLILFSLFMNFEYMMSTYDLQVLMQLHISTVASCGLSANNLIFLCDREMMWEHNTGLEYTITHLNKRRQP